MLMSETGVSSGRSAIQLGLANLLSKGRLLNHSCSPFGMSSVKTEISCFAWGGSWSLRPEEVVRTGVS